MHKGRPPTPSPLDQEPGSLYARLVQTAPIPLDVTLECAAGELLALVGPSGSGKTTVLRCLAGLHAPQSGTVHCAGECWYDTEHKVQISPQRRRVGLVFQQYALFPHFTALQNLTVAMGHVPVAQRRQRALDLLERVRMLGLENRKPGQLSGGQRQRIAIARALAREPNALLLDEPFSAVDQLTRRRLRRELAQLRQTITIPIVLVTHDLDEAQALADRMSVLHRGTTLQTASTAHVMTRPNTAEVARLLDHRNVFEAVVLEQDADGGRTWIQWAKSRLECEFNPAFSPGQVVDWVVPQGAIVMHRRGRPSRGERENPISGRVTELVGLGDEINVTLAVAQAKHPLTFAVSLHVANRNGIKMGSEVSVSLLRSGIHLMTQR